MINRYEYGKSAKIADEDHYVFATTPDGKSNWIVCYCVGEARAKLITRALNITETISLVVEEEGT